jgi:EAL domain-containing protein (putative c-di-GMP-specific phosphodiesterase class I)/GGDEF domain-containing protein
MAIVLLHVAFVRQFPSDRARYFRKLLVVCMLECITNIFSCLGLANTDLIPQWANELLAFAFFALEGLASFLIFRYIMVACELRGKEQKLVRWGGSIPYAVFESLVVLNHWIGFFYYFEDDVYHQGFGADFGYLYITCYFLLDLVLVVVHRKVLNKRTKCIIAVYTVVAMAAILIQFQIRGILLTSIANAIIILMIYLAMQNPSELLDPITGIGNESAFRLQLKNCINHDKQQTSAIMIQIQKLSNITAVIGVENSNCAMREIGTYLYQLCGKFHVFRTSESAFVVLLDSREQEELTCKALQERFGQEWDAGAARVVLDMKLVIQHCPDDFTSVSEYLGMRNFLLEETTGLENMSVIRADADNVKRYRRRVGVEMAVAKAIREKTFEVYYQPIYALKEKRIVSLEALIRLRDDELGYIPPDEFISLAERDGNIIPIGEIVLEESCRFLSRHVLSNMSLGIRMIHINISIAQCLRENMTEMIAPVLERYHVPASMITLELTERMAVENPELMRRHMKSLRDMGISFAMDDYGTGNSNCACLIQLPFQEVKIDKEFTKSYFESENARVVLQNTIQTMQRRGIPVVIEGVESQEQSDEMARLGADYIQGYYYGRPLPEKECLRYIRSFNTGTEEYGNA